MSTKAILAALAGGIVAFFGGWLIFGFLLMDFYTANTTVYQGLMKEVPDMVPLVISNLAWAFLYAFIFYRWANVRSFASGFINGMLISFFIVLAFDTSMYSFFNLYSLTLIVVDIIAGTIFGGLIGGVIGLVLGTGNQD